MRTDKSDPGYASDSARWPSSANFNRTKHRETLCHLPAFEAWKITWAAASLKLVKIWLSQRVCPAKLTDRPETAGGLGCSSPAVALLFVLMPVNNSAFLILSWPTNYHLSESRTRCDGKVWWESVVEGFQRPALCSGRDVLSAYYGNTIYLIYSPEITFLGYSYRMPRPNSRFVAWG